MDDGVVDGTSDGIDDGAEDGTSDGIDDGAEDGTSEGIDDKINSIEVGVTEKKSVGASDGTSDAAVEGTSDKTVEGVSLGTLLTNESVSMGSSTSAEITTFKNCIQVIPFSSSFFRNTSMNSLVKSTT